MAKNIKHKKILICASSIITINTFLLSFLKELSKFYEVYVTTNLDNINKENIFSIESSYQFKFIHIPIRRKINIFYDLYTLVKLIFIIRKHRFDITLSLTPKGGLLTAISSFINNIKTRIHIFNGQIWYNKKSFKRKFLKSFDLITYIFSNKILCESFSQSDFLKREGFIRKKINVISYGSLMGVDIELYKPNLKKRLEIRDKLNISLKQKVCMFIGRINKDKGIDLILAASKYFSNDPKIIFLLIGDNEIDANEFLNLTSVYENIIYLGHKDNIYDYLNVAEFTILPSYREGFGISVIEAASMEKIALVSNIDGLKDTIVPNKTGFFFDSGNKTDFISKLNYMFNNNSLLKNMGKKARKNVKEKYEKSFVINNYINFIRGLD